MSGLNKVMVIGNLGQDPEKRVTPQGKSVVTISLAVSEKYNGQEHTEWINCTFWDKKADLIEKYCRKGSKLYVEGSLKTSSWQDKEGQKRYKTEVQGFQMQFLDSKGQGQAQGGNQAQQGYGAYDQSPPNQGAPQGVPQNGDHLEDDIPY